MACWAIGHLPLGQRREQGVGQTDDRQRGHADVHRAVTAVDDGAGAGTDDRAVVVQVIDAAGQVRQPQHLGALQLGRGNPQTLDGQGDVPGMSVGQLQRGRQVDWQQLFAGFRRRRRQLLGRRGTWDCRQRRAHQATSRHHGDPNGPGTIVGNHRGGLALLG